MARQARLIVPGLPHHIVQRGHNRQPVFVENRDFEYYLGNLQEWKHALGLQVYSYCLMTNHIHLVVHANDELAAILQLMKRLAGRQTRFVNRIERRTGSLWEGRSKVSPIDTDEYLLSCCRYVELNPVKAGMVSAAEDYPWSSYGARIGLVCGEWLDEPLTLIGLGDDEVTQRERYLEFVEDTTFSPRDDRIRTAIDRNQLTGGDRLLHRGSRAPNRGTRRKQRPRAA